jgi:hypothetical protein
MDTETNQMIQMYEAMNDQLHFKNEAIRACCDSQAIQQSIMQQQITELLAQQSIEPNRFSPDSSMDQDNKRNTPATPTTMSSSPGQIHKKPATEIAPKNLLDSLNKTQKQQPLH